MSERTFVDGREFAKLVEENKLIRLQTLAQAAKICREVTAENLGLVGVTLLSEVCARRITALQESDTEEDTDGRDITDNGIERK